MFVPRKTYHVIGDTSASPAENEAATAVQMSPARCDVPEAESSDRLPLDTLVSRMRDPTFVARHRRGVSLRETSAHVSPVMLAVCSRDSLYVRSWRAHARRCPSCARIFNYFRISLEVE
jgi:hypothetical protein